MSDYIAELRRELVGAADRERRRSAPRRALRRSRRAIVPALAGAVAVVGAVLGLAVLGRDDPAPPQSPGVIATIPLGGIPQGVAVGDGSVWVTEFGGRLLRLDPRSRRVIATVQVGTSATQLSASDDAVWAMGAIDEGGQRKRLVRVDPATDRIAARIGSFGWAGAILAAAPEALWLQADRQTPGPLRRLDPTTNRIEGAFGPARRVAMAVGGGRLWTLTEDGLLEWRDAATGRPLGRRAGFAPRPPGGPYWNTIAADADGAFVATGENGSVTRLSADGRIEWAVAVGANGALAVAEHAVWVTTEDGTQRNAQLLRLDPDDGEVTGRIPLRSRLPVGLAVVGDELWAALSDSTAIVVR
jgi:DNA-binding beta-propeller fold protein YncE